MERPSRSRPGARSARPSAQCLPLGLDSPVGPEQINLAPFKRSYETEQVRSSSHGPVQIAAHGSAPVGYLPQPTGFMCGAVSVVVTAVKSIRALFRSYGLFAKRPFAAPDAALVHCCRSSSRPNQRAHEGDSRCGAAVLVRANRTSSHVCRAVRRQRLCKLLLPDRPLPLCPFRAAGEKRSTKDPSARCLCSECPFVSKQNARTVISTKVESVSPSEG